MNGKITTIILIFSIFLFGIFTAYKYQNDQKNTVIKQLENCNNNLSNKQQIVPTISDNDLKLIDEKNKLASSSATGKMYFIANKTQTGNDQYTIDIYLNSNDQKVIADAADLTLILNNKAIVEDMITGDAFPLFPRKTNLNNNITVTGVSSVTDDNITIGKPDKLFLKLKIRITDHTSNSPLLFLNSEVSKIYASAQNITDYEKNFSVVE
jgi:hypothetical protein